jgi:membrane protease YdiL (CAAX protease family)
MVTLIGYIQGSVREFLLESDQMHGLWTQLFAGAVAVLFPDLQIFSIVDDIAVGTAVPMLMHPGELLAAFVWFSLVTWLMVRTKNIWDCVAAHAVTNLLLGIYVVTQHQWQLW